MTVADAMTRSWNEISGQNLDASPANAANPVTNNPETMPAATSRAVHWRLKLTQPSRPLNHARRTAAKDQSIAADPGDSIRAVPMTAKIRPIVE